MLATLQAWRRGEFEAMSWFDIAMSLWKVRADKHGTVLTRLPDSMFFKHMVIFGTTGSGKSNVYEILIKRWMPAVLRGQMSLIVIDGSVFPNRVIRYVDHVLNQLGSRRIILLDPQTGKGARTDHFLESNIFDVPAQIKDDVPADFLIGTYVEVCNSLLDQPLTPLMKTLFMNAVQLMMAAGDPSMKLLREVLRDPEYFLDDRDIDCCPEVERFFREAVLVKQSSYQRQRQDIIARLDGLLSSPTIRHMFCSDHPKINLYDEVLKGCLLLVATRSASVSDDCAKTIGRLAIMLAGQISQMKAYIDGVPSEMIGDEIPDYTVGKDIPSLRVSYKKDRKNEDGRAVALQQPDDMCSDLFKTVTGNSAIKMVGKLENNDDAAKLGKIMGVPAEEIMALETGQFFCKVRDLHDRAIKITIRPGALGFWRNDAQRKVMKKEALDSVLKCRRLMAKRFGTAPKKPTRTTKHYAKPRLIVGGVR